MSNEWTVANSAPGIEQAPCQLWKIHFDPTDESSAKPDTQLGRSIELLTPEERSRAERIKASSARTEFIIARGALRKLLGQIAAVDPRTLSLEVGPHGKPYPTGLGRPVFFNVAHSNGVILIAFSAIGEVGVDVEYRNPTIEWREIARMVLHPQELLRLDRCESEATALDLFYEYWCCKEAVLKADGRGLLSDPASLLVELDQGEERRVYLPSNLSGQTFFVRTIRTSSSHAAALASKVPNLDFRYYEHPV